MTRSPLTESHPRSILQNYDGPEVQKIGIVAPPWYPTGALGLGGTENAISCLILGLRDLGFQVTFFGPGQSQVPEGVTFVPLTPRPFRLREEPVAWDDHQEALAYYATLVELVRESDLDILHLALSSTTDRDMFPLLGMVKVPVIITGHTRWPLDPSIQNWEPTAKKEPLLPWMRRYPILAPSLFAQEQVLNFLDPIGFVHHGLVPGAFAPVPREEFRLDLPERFACWVGTFTPGKAPHEAIMAVKQYNRAHTDDPLALVLAGIYDKDVSLQVEYFQGRILPHIDDREIFFHGPASFSERSELLTRARVFLNPTNWDETFGFVTVEPQAVGTPVIAKRLGPNGELIQHGISGILMEREDTTDDWATAIGLSLTLDRTRIAQLANRQFSHLTMAREHLRFYNQVAFPSGQD